MIFTHTPLFRSLAMAGCIATAVVALTGCEDQQAQQIEQAKILLKSADAYHDQGQFRAAISELQSSLEISNTLEANIQLAEIFNELRQSASAEKLLQPLLTTYPDEVRYELSRSYLLRNKHRSALNLLDEGAQPEKGLLALNRFEAQIGLKDLEAAEKTLDSLEPSVAQEDRAQLLKLDLFVAQNDKSRSQQQLAYLQENFAGSASVQTRLGKLAHGQNDLNGAEAAFTKALSQLPQTDMMTPRKLEVLSLLSDTLTRKGRFTEAMVYKQLIAENNPDLQTTQKAYEQAITEIKLGNYDKAEQILTELAQQYPNADQINTMLGVINLQQGDLKQAGDLLGSSIDPETAKPELVNATAAAQLRLNRPEEALVLLEQALKESPDNAQMLTLYGLTAARIEGQEKKGELALQKALALAPENISVRVALAQYYFSLKQVEMGLSQLQKATQTAPDNTQVTMFYYRALMEAQELENAEAFIVSREKSKPEALATWQMRAAFEQSKGNTQGAIQALDKAITLAPDNANLKVAKAQLYLREGQPVKARENYHLAIKQAPDNTTALKGMVSASEASGSAKPAIDYLTKLASTEQGESASAVLIEYYLRNRQLADAQKVAQTLKSRVGLSDYSQAILANVYHKTALQARADKDYPAAETAYQQALSVAPKSERLMLELGVLKLEQDDISGAQSIQQELAKLSAHSSAAILAAEIAKKQNKPEEALSILSKAYTETPTAELARSLYAVQKSQGDTATSQTLSDWRERFPNDSRAILEAANLALQSQNNNEAVKLYEQALTLSSRNVLVLNNLAWLYGERGDMDKAEAMALQAVKLAPESASILDTAGWILVRNGKKDGLSMLEKANSLAPDNTEIAEHYRKAQDMPL